MSVVAIGTIKEILDRYGEKVVSALNDNLEFKKNIASGDLAKSIRFKVFSVSDVHTFELFIDDYYKWVDKGRKSGKRPPIAPILKWLSYKQLSGVVNSKKAKAGVVKGNALKSMAYAVATNIGKHGTKGSHFYSDVFKSGGVGDITILEQEISEALRQSIKIQIIGDLGEV